MMLNTCALYGTTTYTNSWLGINFIVILISLMIVAVAWSLSSFFPAETRSRIRSVSRFEMIQAVISVAILAILLGFSLATCTISSTISTTLAHTSMNPFQYANYYIGATLNSGVTLLSNIYASSVSYAVTASLWQNGAAFIYSSIKLRNIPIRNLLTTPSLTSATQFGKLSNFLDITFGIQNVDMSQAFYSLSVIYIQIFSPIIIIALGLLFIQFFLLPLMQSIAFTIILPVAIAMRSLAFTSSNIGSAANSLIAIAIALYLIYPMTVAFDSYAVAWVFSASNPGSQYMNTAFTLNSIKPASYFTTSPSSSTLLGVNTSGTLLGMEVNAGTFIFKACSSAGGNPGCLAITPLFTAPLQLERYVNQMSQLVFVSILLFVLNISITIGLAMSIHKALNSGLGESARFW
jgi:hypothetical protein